MAGIDSHFRVAPVSTTVAGTAVNVTTPATAITVLYVNADHVMLGFENTTNVAVIISRQPVTVAGNSTTVTGTAAYFKTVPAGAYRVFDVKANTVAFGPAVYGVYAAATPASGIVEMISVKAK